MLLCFIQCYCCRRHNNNASDETFEWVRSYQALLRPYDSITRPARQARGWSDMESTLSHAHLTRRPQWHNYR